MIRLGQRKLCFSLRDFFKKLVKIKVIEMTIFAVNLLHYSILCMLSALAQNLLMGAACQLSNDLSDWKKEAIPLEKSGFTPTRM